MPFLPKLFQVVDSIFAGTGLDQMRNDTIVLLREIIEEADDSEVEGLIKELCESMAAALTAQGKQIDPEACTDLLYRTVMEERAKFKARTMVKRIRRRRRGTGQNLYEF